MAEEKSELSSLQERLKAMRDAQKAKENPAKDAEPTAEPAKPAKKTTPPPPKAKPEPEPAEEAPAPPPVTQDPDDAAARIRKRLEQAAAKPPEAKKEENPEPKPEPKPPAPAEEKPENPADRLRSLLEKHRQEQQRETPAEETPPPKSEPKPEPKPEPKREPKPEPVAEAAFVPAPAPTFSASPAPSLSPYSAPAAQPAKKPTLRYRLRLRLDKFKKTKVGKLCLRTTSFFMRLATAGSLVALVALSLAVMADRYCSMNDLLLAYCQKGIAPMEACQRDYGTFDVTDSRYWQQLQNYYDYGFVIPWNYVYVLGGHALAAVILGLMGLYHGPKVYRKILRFLTFPLRKVGLFKRL